ncbi:hypothetical protein ACS0TY_017332 [Phlomoides rotata]
MAASTFDRELAVYDAKLAEHAKRYDDMVEAMKKVAKTVGELTADERNLLSVGYKKVIEPRIACCRKLSSIALEPSVDAASTNQVIEYWEKVETEITDICADILSIIDEHLIPSCKPGDPTSTVFYLKMKGDYFKYLAEFRTGMDRSEASDESLKAYEDAMKIAREELPPTHPIRLGLALNYSVFCYEISFSPERAMEITEEAYDEAYPGLGRLNEEEYKDSNKILQLLKDNYTLWNAEISGDESCFDSILATI